MYILKLITILLDDNLYKEVLYKSTSLSAYVHTCTSVFIVHCACVAKHKCCVSQEFERRPLIIAVLLSQTRQCFLRNLERSWYLLCGEDLGIRSINLAMMFSSDIQHHVFNFTAK